MVRPGTGRANHTFALCSIAGPLRALLVGRAEEDGVVRMRLGSPDLARSAVAGATRDYLDMLLQVLRALEALATEVALVRLQRDMDTNMRGDVVALNSGGTAEVPTTGQVEIVGALATDMALADVLLEGVSGTTQDAGRGGDRGRRRGTARTGARLRPRRGPLT